MKNAVM